MKSKYEEINEHLKKIEIPKACKKMKEISKELANQQREEDLEKSDRIFQLSEFLLHHKNLTESPGKNIKKITDIDIKTHKKMEEVESRANEILEAIDNIEHHITKVEDKIPMRRMEPMDVHGKICKTRKNIKETPLAKDVIKELENLIKKQINYYKELLPAHDKTALSSLYPVSPGTRRNIIKKGHNLAFKECLERLESKAKTFPEIYKKAERIVEEISFRNCYHIVKGNHETIVKILLESWESAQNLEDIDFKKTKETLESNSVCLKQ